MTRLFAVEWLAVGASISVGWKLDVLTGASARHSPLSQDKAERLRASQGTTTGGITRSGLSHSFSEDDCCHLL